MLGRQTVALEQQRRGGHAVLGARGCRAAVACLLLISLIMVPGCGGCSGGPSSVRGGNPWQPYGGMGKAAWEKQRAEAEKKAEEDEAKKKAEEEAKRKEEAAKKPPPPATAAAPAATAAPATAAAAAKPPAPNTPAAPPAASPAPTAAAPAATPVAAASVPAADQFPPLPRRPSDVNGWSEHDVMAARLSNDAQLLLWLQQRAQAPERTSDDARLLYALLSADEIARRREEGVFGASTAQTTAVAPADLIKAIITALVANGRPEAVDTLEQVVGGTLKVDDDRVAVAAALGGLAQVPGARGERILLAALTHPESLRPPGRGVVAAPEMRQTAFELLKASQNEGLRAAVARTLVQNGADLAPEVRPLMEQIVFEVTPANLEAHALLLSTPSLPAEFRATVLRSFANYSSDALGYWMGLPDKRAAIGGPRWPALVAERLWSDSFVSSLDPRHEESRSMSEVAPVLLLSATIPNDLSRVRVYRTIERHWEEGPSSLNLADAALVIDPGTIVVLKQFCRRVARTAVARKSLSGRVSPTALEQHGQWQQRKQKVADEWENLTLQLVHRTCERCRAAGSLAESAVSPGELRANVAQLPFTVHEHAAVRVAYPFVLPQPSPEGGAAIGASPLKVRYVRIEEKAAPSRLLGFYKRQLKLAEEVRNSGDPHLDVLEEADDAPHGSRPTLRSIDIFFTRAKPDLAIPAEEEQELTIEILVVEAERPINALAASRPS